MLGDKGSLVWEEEGTLWGIPFWESFFASFKSVFPIFTIFFFVITSAKVMWQRFFCLCFWLLTVCFWQKTSDQMFKSKLLLKYIKCRKLQCFLLFPKLSSVEFFIIGAIAKAVATIITYPLQTIQSILQVGFYTCILEVWIIFQFLIIVSRKWKGFKRVCFDFSCASIKILMKSQGYCPV